MENPLNTIKGLGEAKKNAMSSVSLALLLLSVFLLTQIVTEVKDWRSDGEYATNTITVSGIGEVFAVPDIATFNFRVESVADSAEAAQSDSTEIMNGALAYLKDKGIDEKDIKTTSYNVGPKYEYRPCTGFSCPPSNRELVGYEVSQNVTVKVRETEEAGEILSGISGKGVTNISSLQFTIDDTDKLREEARSQAVADAKEKAEKLADDLGVKIKKVVSFNEGGNSGPPMMYLERGVSDMVIESSAVAPELPVGENTITSNVSITYEIK